MRRFIGAFVVGSCVLMGALPVAAGQSNISGPAAASESPADRDSYTRKARDDMRAWQQKLHDFSATATAKGQAGTVAAEHDLNAAWARTQAEGNRLQAASAADWDSVKASYEKASRNLADTWDRIRPGDK